MSLLITNVVLYLEHLHKQAENPLPIHKKVQPSGYININT